MPKKPKQDGLVQVGQMDLLTGMVKEAQALTPAKEKLLNAAVEIRQNPDATEAAYMARQLVQCTLPHSDPGDVPVWTRTNGNLTLVITRTVFDEKAGKLVGYPYGTIPRLLLFWLTAEAVQKKNPRIELGRSLSEFMRAIGLGAYQLKSARSVEEERRNTYNGTGKRSDARRLRDQMERLFGAHIGFQQSLSSGSFEGRRVLQMPVVEAQELWWSPKHPEQGTLWGSWIELGSKFYAAITAAPVPLDVRALRALKRSPLALDLYAWATYKAFAVGRKGVPDFIPWEGLRQQLGADYGDPQNFRKKVTAAMRKVTTVYPGFKTRPGDGGFLILPQSTPAIRGRVEKPVSLT